MRETKKDIGDLLDKFMSGLGFVYKQGGWRFRK